MSRLRNAIAAGGAVTAAGALAVTLIGDFEGLRLKSYPDVIGVWTVCYGETKNIRPGMTFTKAECDRMFLDSIVAHERGMRACLDDPDSIPMRPYIAFVSLTYNIGVANFCRSTLRRLLNAGDVGGACLEFSKWNKAGGKEVRGLTLRRERERKFCLEGAIP